jgi:hypothetical protein
MNHITLFVLLVLSSIVKAETNSCRDPEGNKTWEQVKRNHRREGDIEALHALRAQLCWQIDAGILNVQEATERFETERERVIQERREYNRKQEAGGVGLGQPTLRGWLGRARITLPTGMSSIRIARVVHAHPRTTLG